MKRFTCDRCKERVLLEEERAHTADQCKAAAKTYAYLRHRLRPFPIGHSLPAWMRAPYEDETRGAYEGEPREEQALLAIPERQFWVPRWVDIVVELWVGAVHLEGPLRQAQRDGVLAALNIDPMLQRKVVDARREDLRAVRALLAPLVLGPLPPLLSEVSDDQALRSRS